MQDFHFARKVFGEDFLYERHINYLLKSLKKSTYGAPLEVAEAHRLSSLFFVVSGLDLLDALDKRLTQADKQNIIQWIYSYQVDVNHILLPNDLIRPYDEVKDIDELDNDQDQDEAVEGDEDDSETEYNNFRNRLGYVTNNKDHLNGQEPNDNDNSNNKDHFYGQEPNDNNNYHHHLNDHDNNVQIVPQENNNHHHNHNNHTNQRQRHRSQKFRQRAKHICLTKSVGHAGFRATSMIDSDIPLDFGVLPMTYCALATLVILGDDLKRVDKGSILKGMRQLQSPDGSFMPTIFGGETDMRLVYCAVAVSKLLNDWSGMDKDKCARFIRNSLTYEGAFGQCPGAEAHGGSTFCALASLKLMSKLDETMSQEEQDRLVRWCLMRFENGFCGRPNKDEDTCYSFWIGACLVILDKFQFIEDQRLLDFILMAQEERGGLAKVPDFYSDPIHTYLGFAGLTFIDRDLCSKRGVNLLKLDPTLNISARARAYLDKLHEATATPSSTNTITNTDKRLDLISTNNLTTTTMTTDGLPSSDVDCNVRGDLVSEMDIYRGCK